MFDSQLLHVMLLLLVCTDVRCDLYSDYENPCNAETQAELEEIKSTIEDLKKDVVALRQKIDTDFKLTSPDSKCPFGFDYLPDAGSCFAIIFEEMSWYSATARCRAIMPGAHLAAIKSQQESNAIARYLHSEFSRTGAKSSGSLNWCLSGYLVWTSGQTKTGRCSRNDTPFVWKTLPGLETPFNHTNWGPGEPNCASEDEGCLHISSCKNHAWNDTRCQLSFFPLCQISL